MRGKNKLHKAVAFAAAPARISYGRVIAKSVALIFAVLALTVLVTFASFPLYEVISGKLVALLPVLTGILALTFSLHKIGSWKQEADDEFESTFVSSYASTYVLPAVEDFLAQLASDGRALVEITGNAAVTNNAVKSLIKNTYSAKGSPIDVRYRVFINDRATYNIVKVRMSLESNYFTIESVMVAEEEDLRR